MEVQGGGGLAARAARDKLEAAAGFIERNIADIEAEMRMLRTKARGDVRLLFGAMVAVALGLAAIMAKGFHWF